MKLNFPFTAFSLILLILTCFTALAQPGAGGPEATEASAGFPIDGSFLAIAVGGIGLVARLLRRKD